MKNKKHKNPTPYIEIDYINATSLKSLITNKDFVEYIISTSLERVEYALENNLDTVELLNIYNLSIIIELKNKDYIDVLSNIEKFYASIEDYEKCSNIQKLIQKYEKI